MSYFIKSGLGDASSCGPDQQWDPNYVYGTLPPGQCTPKGSPMTPAPSKSLSSIAVDIFNTLTKPAAVVPAAQAYVPPQSSGISTTTLALAGGAALLLIVLAARR